MAVLGPMMAIKFGRPSSDTTAGSSGVLRRNILLLSIKEISFPVDGRDVTATDERRRSIAYGEALDRGREAHPEVVAFEEDLRARLGERAKPPAR